MRSPDSGWFRLLYVLQFSGSLVQLPVCLHLYTFVCSFACLTLALAAVALALLFVHRPVSVCLSSLSYGVCLYLCCLCMCMCVCVSVIVPFLVLLRYTHAIRVFGLASKNNRECIAGCFWMHFDFQSSFFSLFKKMVFFLLCLLN